VHAHSAKPARVTVRASRRPARRPCVLYSVTGSITPAATKLHGPVWPPQRRSDSTVPVWSEHTSRKYAYQVLLTEEWLRHGVETIFIKASQSKTPEDQLLLQFQGMIAEYERAQILERSRRGKRHRAKQAATEKSRADQVHPRLIGQTENVGPAGGPRHAVLCKQRAPHEEGR
jgi:hypothetical protein